MRKIMVEADRPQVTI